MRTQYCPIHRAGLDFEQLIDRHRILHRAGRRLSRGIADHQNQEYCSEGKAHDGFKNLLFRVDRLDKELKPIQRKMPPIFTRGWEAPITRTLEACAT